MGYSRQKAVAQAQSWIGCNEADGSHKKIIDVYNAYKPWTHQSTCRKVTMDYSWAWCQCFASAVAIASGNADIVPLEISCYYAIEAAKKMGCWQEADTYVPKAGDYVEYYWSASEGECSDGASHVGIVEKVEGSTATIIEGNMSNKVGRRTITIGSNVYKYVRGWITPAYTEETTTETKTETKTETTTKTTVGYASSYDKSLAGTYIVNASDGLNIRCGAGTDYAKLGTLANGSKVQMYGYYTKNWYYVIGSGITGFVCADYLTKKTTTVSSNTKSTTTNLVASSTKSYAISGTATPNKTEKAVGKVTASSLNVRTGAGTSNANLKSYPYLGKDNLVSLCDAILAENGSNWYYIKIANKYYGYVSAKYITIV